MRRAIFRLYACLVLAALSFPLNAGGLKFNGMSKKIDDRTSYDVFANRQPRFRHNVTIEFQIRTYLDNEKDFRGNIFRLANRKDSTILNLYYDGAGDFHRFTLNAENSSVLIKLRRQKLSGMDISEWMKVTFTLDMDKDSVFLSVDRDTIASAIPEYNNTLVPELCFGKSGYIIDVPTFAIRDLKIYNDRTRIEFPLDEKAGNDVSDKSGVKYGRTQKPVWLSEGSYKWSRIAKIRSNDFMSTGYDTRRHVVWAFTQDSLYSYDIQARHGIKRRFNTPCPVNIAIGTNFVNPNTGKVYAYEVWYNDDAPDSCTTAVLDTAAMSWSALSYGRLDMQMHHHTEWFDTTGNALYIFGGFGNEKYNGRFFRYSLDSLAWTECLPLAGNVPCPRYFCTMGHNPYDNALYVYGGMGNESGQQILGRKYLYDLYRIDPTDFKAKRLWTMQWDGENRVAARNMVIPQPDCFYALCYPESVTESKLQLCRFNIADGTMEEVGNTIPIFSDKITTNANLFYDEAMSLMIAVVEESADDISSSVSVYSINYPPVVAPVETVGAEEKKGVNKTLPLIAVLLIISTASVTLLFVQRKRLRHRTIKISSEERQYGNMIRPVKEKTNQIFLFGNFTVLDKDGEDITAMFPERVREMFFLTLQHTDNGGITPKRLSSLIWPDKDEDKAKNIRGVTVNNLRKALSCLKGVSLKFAGGKYLIEFDEGTFCDYWECMKEIHRYKTGNSKLLSILARGKFLLAEQDELFDKLKDDTENSIDPIVREEAKYRCQAEDWDNALLCANILFLIDPLNEDALKIAVNALVMSGRDDDARVRYNSFISRYKRDYGENYGTSFESLIS